MTTRGWLKRQTLLRVIVHTKNGSTIDGVLAERAADGLVLRHAKYVGEGEPIPVKGTVFIEREQLDFVQVMTEGPI